MFERLTTTDFAVTFTKTDHLELTLTNWSLTLHLSLFCIRQKYLLQTLDFSRRIVIIVLTFRKENADGE